MHCKYDDRRETANSMLARGRPQYIMRRRKQGDKNDTVDRFRIWINALVMWDETQLPGNEARLLNTTVSAHIHVTIPEESTSRLPRGDNRDSRNTRHIKPLQRQGQQQARAT